MFDNDFRVHLCHINTYYCQLLGTHKKDSRCIDSYNHMNDFHYKREAADNVFHTIEASIKGCQTEVN